MFLSYCLTKTEMKLEVFYSAQNIMTLLFQEIIAQLNSILYFNSQAVSVFQFRTGITQSTLTSKPPTSDHDGKKHTQHTHTNKKRERELIYNITI